MTMMRSRKSRGVALIVVLGVLVVLVLMAVTFATVEGVNRDVSRNFLDLVRAKLTAESGVEYAVAELRRQIETGPVAAGRLPWRYYGDDLKEDGSANQTTAIELARNPSFAIEQDGDPLQGAPDPIQVRIEGQLRGLSGTISGAYGASGQFYTLRVSDASSKIHVNEGVGQQPVSGTESTGTQNLRRILNHLGNAVAPSIAGLGTRVVSARPTAGYKSVHELRTVLTQPELDRILPFVTANTWVDRNVANPVPFSALHAQQIQSRFGVQYYRGPGPAIYRYGRGKDYTGRAISSVNPAWGELQICPPASPNGVLHGVYAMDELNPQWIEITSRAPVNVNTAPREVLVALLSDLRGVFVSERRRNNIETKRVGGYHYMKILHSNSPANRPSLPFNDTKWGWPSTYNQVGEGDEFGLLYETQPILPATSGTTSGGANTAVAVAEHLLACRESRATRNVTPSGDYAGADFRGPFRTWRQFHAFCDNLVTLKVLDDPRASLFLDHSPVVTGPGNITGDAPLVASEVQRRAASQAMADVLKANFNPNLHLNELNPDRNLFLMVDKTDLVVASTEFCLAPTGYYDIECLGRVLEPLDPVNKNSLVVDNRLRASSKLHAGVKLFDVVRQTSQADFMGGTIDERTGAAVTNNNRSLEVGPEPDNGRNPWENEWSGYLALPTVGGNLSTAGNLKPSGKNLSPNASTLPTPAAAATESCSMGATIHTHLSWDHDAHHHADGVDKRRDLASWVNCPDPTVQVRNYPDRTETLQGPYDPVDGANRYRLARSMRYDPVTKTFRLQGDTGTGTGSGAVFDERAPQDLRIDGSYNERHAGLAYWLSTTSYVANTRAKEGAISYWIKPAFHPERTGKPRGFIDMTHRRKAPASWGWEELFLAAHCQNFWNAGQDTAPWTSSSNEYSTLWAERINFNDYEFGPTPMRPQSMIFGVGYGMLTGFATALSGTTPPGRPVGSSLYYQFFETPSLNHLVHAGCSLPSVFKGHEWMNVVLSWKKTTTPNLPPEHPEIPPPSPPIPPLTGPPYDGQTTSDYRVYVNGSMQSSWLAVFILGQPECEIDDLIDWTRHQNGDLNALRFGAPSEIGGAPTGGVKYFYDNFAADGTVDEIYFWNKQSMENNALSHWLGGRYSLPAADTGTFTSTALPVAAGTERMVAPPAGGGTTTTTPAGAVVRLMGLSWTWYADGVELVSGTLVPTLADHGPAGGTLYPKVEAAVVGVTPAGSWLTDDAYSIVTDALGNTLVTLPVSSVQYRLRFTIPGADPLNTILLSTPVVDDVTLYLSCAETAYTYYYHDALAQG